MKKFLIAIMVINVATHTSSLNIITLFGKAKEYKLTPIPNVLNITQHSINCIITSG